MGNPSQSYGASLAIWDHTVLPTTRHKWMRPARTPANQAGTRFTYTVSWITSLKCTDISQGSVNWNETKLSCNKTELKLCNKNAMHWIKSSLWGHHLNLTDLWPCNDKKLPCWLVHWAQSTDSTAMGWKRNWVPKSAHLAVLHSATASAADQELLAAGSKHILSSGPTAMTSHVKVFPPAQGTSISHQVVGKMRNAESKMRNQKLWKWMRNGG